MRLTQLIPNSTRVLLLTAAVTLMLAAAPRAANAASTVVLTPPASSIMSSVSGGPVVFTRGNIVVRCPSSVFSLQYSTPPGGLPLPTLAVLYYAPTFTGCSGTRAGLPQQTTVSFVVTGWSMGLSTTDYTGSLNVPAAGLTVAVGSCTSTVSSSPIAISFRDASGAIPPLGLPASQMYINGSVPVTPSCSGLPASMTVVADGSVSGGVATGRYPLPPNMLTEF
jgi:hypothetical protein